MPARIAGAPHQRAAPPLLPIQPEEQRIYFDNVVAVTTTRVIVGGTTYALRNITSVKMTYTPRKALGAILLLFFGLLLLLVGFISIHSKTPAPIGVYVIGGAMVVGGIVLILTAKTSYHVNLSRAAGELHALTSNDQAYIEKLVGSINEAMATCQQ